MTPGIQGRAAHVVSKQTRYESLKTSCRRWHGDMPGSDKGRVAAAGTRLTSTSGVCTGHIGFWSREYCAATKTPAERDPSDGYDTCRGGAVRQGCRRPEACRFRSRWA